MKNTNKKIEDVIFWAIQGEISWAIIDSVWDVVASQRAATTDATIAATWEVVIDSIDEFVGRVKDF
jgi:hypothetical protein